MEPPRLAASLDLGLHYVQYDRTTGVTCLWSGGGIGPAVGYGYKLPDASVPIDSIGDACYLEGSCETSPLKDTSWVRFRCW